MYLIDINYICTYRLLVIATRIDVHLQNGDVSVYWLWLLLDISAVSIVIVIIAICDMFRQEFSLCERVYIYNKYTVSNFSNFVALCTDDTDTTPVSYDKHFRDFWGACSNLSPVSSNVSSFRTWRRGLTFIIFTQPVSLNRLASPLIVLGLGTCHPGNFIQNLRVSEHDFLLFIYVLWIYTRSRNENSCLGMSHRNNHNNYTY